MLGQVAQSLRRRSLIPNRKLIVSGRNIANGYLAGVIGDGVIRSFQGHHRRAHLRMNIAEDERHARAVKAHRTRAAGFVQPQIEALAFIEREYVVKEGILVGKVHRGADGNHQQVRLEALVFLHQAGMDDGQSRRTGIQWRQPNHDSGIPCGFVVRSVLHLTLVWKSSARERAAGSMATAKTRAAELSERRMFQKATPTARLTWSAADLVSLKE